jgi:hypothetical protein
LHWIVVVGEVESAVAVKFELALVPALFAAETLFEPGSVAVGVNE